MRSILFTALLCLFSAQVFAHEVPKKLVFSINEETVLHVEAEVLRQALMRMGIKAEFRSLPHARALCDANQGHLDGAVGRISETSTRYSNLIMVDAPATVVAPTIFLPSESFIKKPEDLQNAIVGYVRGIQLIQEPTSHLRTHQGMDNHDLMNKLISGHVDAVILDKPDGQRLINGRYAQYGIVEAFAFMPAVKIYPHLHKRHASLAPELAEVMRSMEKNGEAEHIREQMRTKLLLGHGEHVAGQ